MSTVSEIQERHDAVKDMEKKLLDLQQVLNQLVALRGIGFIKIIIKIRDYACTCKKRILIVIFIGVFAFNVMVKSI